MEEKFTSKQCELEYVAIIHCTSASYTLGHLCLLALYTIPIFFIQRNLLFSFYFLLHHMHGVQYIFNAHKISSISGLKCLLPKPVCRRSHVSFT